MDRIFIRDLRVPARVGVSDEERARPQDVLVTIEVEADLSRAGASDDLAHTVDYGGLLKDVSDLVRSSECRLLEHLAEKIASAVSGIERVAGVTVEIKKVSPPVEQETGAIGVRIERP